MLVLARKKNERIFINDGADRGGVTITVIEVRGDRCRLGIEAPRETSVHREEVWIDIAKEKKGGAA